MPTRAARRLPRGCAARRGRRAGRSRALRRRRRRRAARRRRRSSRQPRRAPRGRRAQLVGDESRGRLLLERGLRVGVEVVAPGLHVGHQRGDFGTDVHGGPGNVDGRHRSAIRLARRERGATAALRIDAEDRPAMPSPRDKLSISPSSAPASTARASPATPRGAASRCCWSSRTTSPRATSQWSTKLIHGGLRYLEHYEFRLVRESLAEREVVLRSAPHLVEPLSFVLPHEPHLRPAWMIRAGLFMYDHLGRRETLPGSFGVEPRQHQVGRGAQVALRQGLRLRRRARRRRAPGRANVIAAREPAPTSACARALGRRGATARTAGR